MMATSTATGKGCKRTMVDMEDGAGGATGAATTRKRKTYNDSQLQLSNDTDADGHRGNLADSNKGNNKVSTASCDIKSKQPSVALSSVDPGSSAHSNLESVTQYTALEKAESVETPAAGPSQIPASKQPGPNTRKIDPNTFDAAKFVELLRSCAYSEPAAIAELKDLAKGSSGILWIAISIKGAADERRIAHNKKYKEEGRALIEGWLFLGWLQSYRELIELTGALLETTQPGCEKRVNGLGRIAYTLAWNLVEQYYLDVTLYAKRDPERMEELPTIEPVTDKLKDRLDVWNTQQMGIGLLSDLDEVLALAVTRYRKESRGVPKTMEEKEELLESVGDEIGELTGFGGSAAPGYELFDQSRAAIQKWVDNEPIPKESTKVIVPAGW